MIPNPDKALIGRATTMLALMVVVALSALAFWPGLAGDWGRDDYMQLAMARLVGNPLAFFVHDHFVLPGGVFRPVGYASFWFGQLLGGTEFSLHALHSLILHIGIVIALFALLRRFAVDRIPALLACLFFALHPVAIGTALWWSARFDLLALLFILLSMNLAWQADSRQGKWPLIGSLTCLLAAMLSKETGLLGVPAVLLLLQYRAWTGDAAKRGAWLASALCLLTLAIFLLWRFLVLGTGGSAIVGEEGLATVLFEGSLRWMELAPAYLGFEHGMERGLFLLALLSGVALFLLLIGPARMKKSGDRRLPLWLAASVLLLGPALLQAPIVRLNALPMGDELGAVEAAMQSRLFYMSLAGLALLLGLCIQRSLGPLHRPVNVGLLLASVLLIGAMGSASRDHSRGFAEISRDNALLAHAAVAAVRDIDWPPPPCHLVFEGIQPPPEWGIYVSMDSVIKALHPDLDALDHCFIHANYPTFYHFLSSEHADADSAPVPALIQNGRPLQRRTVGGLTIVHLQQLDALDAEARARLPRWELDSEGRLEPARTADEAGR